MHYLENDEKYLVVNICLGKPQKKYNFFFAVPLRGGKELAIKKKKINLRFKKKVVERFPAGIKLERGGGYGTKIFFFFLWLLLCNEVN